ncbi:MAG: TIGR04282 family arsenosugar biosynthesis glycosyltransferase [Syntrophales bacterium]|nr:TIGR04282 family arsenosugar biosynthesis glycosyltransferase [Syntrophales bacterium]
MSEPSFTRPIPDREVLVIMARYPEAGAVKKRLARDLGTDRTLLVYKAFLQDLGSKFGTQARPLLWFFTPAQSAFAEWMGSRAACRKQSGETLQQRLLGVFEELFGEGFKRVVVLGADCPHLPIADVDAAFEGLRGSDVVLLPSEDGGYNLIGLRLPCDLFTGVALGTGGALSETVDRARSLGLSCHCLTPSFDIDTIEDLQRLRDFLASTDDPLPRTREALAAIWGERERTG